MTLGPGIPLRIARENPVPEQILEREARGMVGRTGFEPVTLCV